MSFQILKDTGNDLDKMSEFMRNQLVNLQEAVRAGIQNGFPSGGSAQHFGNAADSGQMNGGWGCVRSEERPSVPNRSG